VNEGVTSNDDSEVIAAVDLGSNSFHMIVGELRHGQIAIIDRIKETVRLAEGLTATGDLSLVARERATDCLARFGERLRDVRAGNVRAAGTSTIRRAREDSHFLADAEAALGHPIDVISGIEEARLIYTGVFHSMPPYDGERLVMDIGGGSTELILGRGDSPRALESLHLGCVTLTEQCFPEGRISDEGFRAARTKARLELRPVKRFFRNPDVEAVGTSGTINSALTVAMELGITETSALTAPIVEALIERMLAFDHVGKLDLPGLTDGRAQVWPGGLSILAELLDVLRVERLKVSDGALREGLLYDLVGRLRDHDARERTVRAMTARYHTDERQAERVADTAGRLFAQLASRWFEDVGLAKQMLNWACRLHEIGLDISHDGYQRHGAYVAENADMPGFPRAEQRLLAFLIGAQRHTINTKGLKRLPRAWRQGALRLAFVLRLAVLLNRSRTDKTPPIPEVVGGDNALSLHFDQEWLAENPLTLADLDRETHYLSKAGYELRLT